MQPPNLRNTTILIQGLVPSSCGNCVHFFNGKCMKYQEYPVTASKVCDGWEG